MSTLKVGAIRGVSASSDAITVANDGTCTANITNKSNRNLIINGAMQVAQRGTSMNTGDGFAADRFKLEINGTDENPTLTQADIVSGTTPYTLGFRKSWKVQNGNQTSGAGSTDRLQLQYRVEAQDVASSGWNYLSASSFITLSFWIKSSIAQNFFGLLMSMDATQQNFPFETGSLTADTWTKVTKTIPGNSNLTFNNDNGEGLKLEIHMYRGTANTASTVTLNQWAAYDTATRTPDQTTTWYTTNDATIEITGVQLEVSDHASDFQFKSFAEELFACQRYYQQLEGRNNAFNEVLQGCFNGTTAIVVHRNHVGLMRTAPTVTISSLSDFDIEPFDEAPSAMSLRHATKKEICINATCPTSRTEGFAATLALDSASALITIDAEF